MNCLGEVSWLGGQEGSMAAWLGAIIYYKGLGSELAC